MNVRVGSLSKTGFVIYSQGREDLILNVSFTLEAAQKKPEANGGGAEGPGTGGADAGAARRRGAAGVEGSEDAKRSKSNPQDLEIKEFAWIVPTPSLPLSYGQVDDLCFHELDDLVPIYKLVRTGGGGLGGFGGGAEVGEKKPERSLLMYAPQVTGGYTIQPLRAIGREGVRALKDWPAKNGFQPMNDSSLSYYADRGWTLLAIKAAVKGWKTGQAQTLAPLRISFPTSRIVFPMKMATGKVEATLFVLTDTALPDPAKALSSFCFRLDGAKPLARRAVEGKALLRLWQQSALRDAAGAYLYRYTTSPQFLSDGVYPSKFTTDVMFPVSQ